MTTVKQALAMVTGSAQPPWRARDLRKQSNGHPISLRTFINNVGTQRVLIFVQVRPLRLLSSVSTWGELKDKWAAFWNLPDTANELQNARGALFAILAPAGASIAYVSKDGQTVGINGPIGSLLTVQSIRLDNKTDQGLGNIAQGVAAWAGGAGALVASTLGAEGVGEAFLVVGGFAGFAAAGGLIGIGLAELIAGLSPHSLQAPQQGSEPPGTGLGHIAPGEPIVLGDIPPNLGQDLLNYLLYLDLTHVPEPGELPGAGDLAPGEPGGAPPSDNLGWA